MLKEDFLILTSPTLSWLKASFDACDGRGSAAYYSRVRHPLNGWSAAYPETTGYIIETLFDYYDITNEQWLFDYAMDAADWICTLQQPTGALPGGLGEKGEPSVFNTGMMLFGLNAAYRINPKAAYLQCIERAVAWLMSILEEDGAWKQGAYRKDFTPSYYTRVVWAVLDSNKILQDSTLDAKMQKALDFYKAKCTPQHSIKDWAFAQNEPAFTHTIAYTMRGFLEAGVLANDAESITIAEKIAAKIMQSYETHQKIAGDYDLDWKGNFSYVCLTGNAQLSLNFSRLFEVTQNPIYQKYAIILFETVRNAPSRLPITGYNGAIAGSAPMWGRYQKWQYPNWAAKFWLDAAYHLTDR